MNGTKEITEADVVSDFNKLKNINIKTISMLSLVGNKTVNYFTLNERLNTKTKTGISFLDFLKNIYKYNECNYYERFMQNNEHFSLIKNQYSYFKMYHGSICIFKPLIAMQIYDIYKPQSVLDPTMGWGGRLVGACAANVPHYIGIDNNEKLKEPYNKLNLFLSNNSNTTMDLIFQDCLTVNYSELFYDLVLTSPPYYNLEIYGETVPYNSKEEWNNKFYIPMITKTYAGLQNGGHYCLNIPIEIYEKICVPILGECTQKIPLTIRNRGYHKKKYSEYIYVWKKPIG